MMNLPDKGRRAPPPTLKGPAQAVSEAVQAMPGVLSATHWFLHDRTQVDGADFYLDDESRELGHIHLDGEVTSC